MIGLNDIWHRVSLPLNQNIHVFCLSVSVKPRCTRVGLAICLGAFGIGEAQVYLGGVDDQFGCQLASVKPRCTWVGLMISLGVIWYR